MSNTSNGSILSSSSSLSQVSETAKIALTEDDKALARPLKRVKICLSAHPKSLRTIDRDIATQDATQDDDTSTLQSDASDIEIVEVNPEKELGMFCYIFLLITLEFMAIHHRGIEKELVLLNIQFLQVQ